MSSYIWVDDEKALERMVSELSGSESLGMDAEMDSYFVYHTKLCLVQISAQERNYLVDSLKIQDLTALNRLTTDPSIRKVFHAGENDIPFFRERGVLFSHLFDTHLAAKILGLNSKSLAGLVEEYFQVELSKEHQRSDWRQRPLSEEQLQYACQDTVYLSSLADVLQEELRSAGLEVEARQEFEGLERFAPQEKEWDPNGWAKIKGVADLSPVQRAAVAGLYSWREKAAKRLDLAHFRVINNATILAMARKSFKASRELESWLKSRTLKSQSEELYAILNEAWSGDGIEMPDLGKKRFGGLSPDEEALFQRLRRWRNEESQKQQVEPERVFSNRQLKRIAKRGPSEPDQLVGLPSVEPWRLEKYGARLLEVLKGDQAEASSD